MHGLHAVQEEVQRADVDGEEAGERRVEVRNDVTEERNGEDGDDAHNEVEAVRLRLDEEDSEEGKEAETFQESPPTTYVHRSVCIYVTSPTTHSE